MPLIHSVLALALLDTRYTIPDTRGKCIPTLVPLLAQPTLSASMAISIVATPSGAPVTPEAACAAHRSLSER